MSAQSIKLIPTGSPTHAAANATLDLYPEAATLYKFINEGRPTATKPTFVALPSLSSHSTFYDCSRGILYQPQDSPSQSFDETGCDYFLFPTPGKKDYITIDPEIMSLYFTPSQVTKQYGAYTAFPAPKTTSAIIEVKINKILQFQVNQFNIA